MPYTAPLPARLFLFLLVCLNLFVSVARGQQQSPAPETREEPDEIIRVSTDLIQTDVMVFDKQGRFADGLRLDQFELQVDGKAQDISFFERVSAGSINDDAQLAAARFGSQLSAGKVAPPSRGRVVFFFVDDLHLSLASVSTTRQMLLRFVNDEMGQNDEAAIASASGRIGFLQQLTGEKNVLRAALARLNYRPYSVRDHERPTMTEYQALAVARRERDAVDFFVEYILRENPGITRAAAEERVRSRADAILHQAAVVTANTLSALESLVRSSSLLPGRKLVFFFSDGFFLDPHNSTSLDRLRRITDASARSGVIIYTMDARGLVTGVPDAGADVPFDPTGRLSRTDLGETSAGQEPLHTLATETGGRAHLNTNALDASLAKSLKETSLYYLLAWRPDAAQRGDNFRRIEVKIKGRPELAVRVRRGFFASPAPAQSETGRAKSTSSSRPKADSQNSPDAQLLAALRSLHPRAALPTSLAVGYISTPDQGMLLTVSLEIERDALDFRAVGAGHGAEADVAIAVYDEQGKVVGTRRQELAIPAIKQTEQRHIMYSNQFGLAPGLYQVRVASRDRSSGRTGSASQWVEIPDLKKVGFSMSSIFAAERSAKSDEARQDTDAPQAILLSADRRFSQSSWLRFVIYIYNASIGAAPPDVSLLVQIFRDDQPVVTSPLPKISMEGVDDPGRIPYAAELALNRLSAGRYVLRITAIDRAAKASASQRINFTIK